MKNTTIAPKKPSTTKKPSAYILLIAALGSGFLGGMVAGQSDTTTNNTDNTSQLQIVSSEAEVISKIAKEVGESVVSIDVTAQSTAQDFFGNSRQLEQSGSGTGVILDASGIIVTNKHVVPTGTSTVKVTLADGTILNAEVLARDPRNDIAFIKVTDKKGKDLKPAKLGDSAKMEVGDKVVAIGNALGEFQNTVTSGIVSGYGRDITAGEAGDSEALTNLIQTDAAINRGNSGGPLVNINGEVIGINTAITGSDNGQSLGFSIPVNDIKNQISSVLSTGKIQRPYLGVAYRLIDERFAYIYNLPVQKGAYLPPSDGGQVSIVKDSPADKAGLKEKDIITKIDEKEIDEKNSLVGILGNYKPGDMVKLTVLRGNDTLTLDAKLEVAPEE
jgi:serine protease Do